MAAAGLPLVRRAKAGLRSCLVRASAPIASSLYRERPRRRVVALHDIPPELEAEFSRKLRWLKDWCNVVPLGQLQEGRGLDPRRLNLAITFDDAFREHATVAAPLLRELGLPATFFVPYGALNLSGEAARDFSRRNLRRSRSFEFMGEDQLRELASSPLFEIGAHTYSHADLGAATGQELAREVIEARRALEALVGKPVQRLAYPFGSLRNVSRQALREVRAAGFVAAFTIVPSFWSSAGNPLLVGRDSLELTDSDAAWHSFLRGGYDAFSALKTSSLRRQLLHV